MMKRLIGLLCFFGLLYFLTTTNPNRADYVQWLNENALNQSTNFLEKGVLSLVGQTFIDAATTRKDYYLFSIYTSDFKDIGKGEVKVIGVFNQFVPLSKK